jgi:lipid-binding SYLF domain-containing protein
LKLAHLSLVAALVTALAGTCLAADQSSLDQRLEAATRVFKDMAAPPDRSIPVSLLSRAQCVVVVPNVKKGALVLGAAYGAGFMSCREGTGDQWSAPGGVTLSAGSVGGQIGVGTSDIVILAMNQHAKDVLLMSRSKIGTSATASAGPVGHAPAHMNADLLTWTHSNGVFAGVSIKGSTLSQDTDANKELYGRAVTNIEVVSGKVTTPPAAEQLLTALRDYTVQSAKVSRGRR